MISEREYVAMDATELAERVARRELSAAELLEVAITRAERLNPGLNAIVVPMHELARARAQEPLSGPFAGVPFLIKDLFQDYAGVLSTSGSRAYRRAGYTPKHHAEIVVRFLRAGVVVLGRTNTPEFGAKAITNPSAWGPTKNPWDVARTPGGSSGGSAAAVAAGIVPMAGANDGGGSIRIPAAYTGLFGLKPGRMRNPSGPDAIDPMHGAAVQHVLTRSVRDSARMLDVTAGREPGSLPLAAPERPYAQQIERDPPRLRIALSSTSPTGGPVHADAIAAVEDTGRLLSELGHDVELAAPDVDGHALVEDFLAVWFPQLAAHVAEARAAFAACDADFEADTLVMEAVAAATPALAYVRSHARWSTHASALGRFFTRYDALVTPTVAAPPPPADHSDTPAWAERATRAGFALGLSRAIPLARGTIAEVARENLSKVPFTQLANITGVPAMSVPLATFRDGLPLGVQFVADHGREGMLLALAAQLERARPWRSRTPSI